MSILKLKGSSSGYVELTAPATAGNNQITLPTTAGTVAVRDASNNVEVGTGTTIGSPSSNVFTVSTNGSERVRVDSSGRFGVGNASPSAPLDVVTGSSGAIFRYSSASTWLHVLPGDANGNIALRFRANSGSAPNLLFQNDGGTEIARFLTGGGLTFNGDTAAANALDDYEEGSFTPSFSNGGTGTYSQRIGRYTKIGNIVTVHVHIQLSSVGSASGNIQVSGFPFTSNSAVYSGSSTLHANSWSVTRNNLNGLLPPSSTGMDLYYNTGSASALIVQHSDLGTGNILFTLTYQVP